MTTIYVIRNTLKTGRLERMKLLSLDHGSMAATAEDENCVVHVFKGNDWWYDRVLAGREVYARRRKRVAELQRQIEKLNKIKIKLAPKDQA